MSIRVTPVSCAIRRPDVSAIVPTKPPARAPQRTLTAHPCASAIETAALISARCVSACGNVAEEGAVARVELLRVEADVVGEAEQLLHQRLRLPHAPRVRERVHEPERAREEDALVPPPATPSSPL